MRAPDPYMICLRLGTDGILFEFSSRVEQSEAGSPSSSVKFCINYLGEPSAAHLAAEAKPQESDLDSCPSLTRTPIRSITRPRGLLSDHL